MATTLKGILCRVFIPTVLLVSLLACDQSARAGDRGLQADGNWAVFAHTVTAQNSYYAVTWIDNSLLNGDPSARIVVCAGAGWGNSLADPSPLGVFYDNSSARWLVFNQNAQSMQSGMTFNIVVNGPVAAHVTTTLNTESDWTRLDHPDVNGIPYARIVATPVFDGLHHDHPLGAVQTNLGNWAIQNLDSSPMPMGLRFNVLVVGSGLGFVHRVSEQGSPTSRLEFGPTGNLAAKLFVMPVLNINSTNISAVAVGVRREGPYWEIYSRNGSPLARGADYNVVYWSPITVRSVKRTRQHLLVEIDRETASGMTVLLDGVTYATVPHRHRAGVLKVKNAGTTAVSEVRVRDTDGLLSDPFVMQ